MCATACVARRRRRRTHAPRARAQAADVAPGAVVLDAVGRLNLHVEAGETYSFCVWEPTEELQPLAELDLEARLMRDGDDGDDPRELDAREAVAAFRAQWLGRCCAVGQVAVLSLHDCALRLRCAAADTLDAVAREEAVVYNSFRGIITPATTIFLRAQPDAGDDGIREPDSNGDLGVVTRCGALRLRHCPVRRVGVASAHRVTVYTSDGCDRKRRRIFTSGPGSGPRSCDGARTRLRAR